MSGFQRVSISAFFHVASGMAICGHLPKRAEARHGSGVQCPFCQKNVPGLTGLQEAIAFQKHLRTCRKNPNNIVLRDKFRVAVVPKREQDLRETLDIRAESGQ